MKDRFIKKDGMLFMRCNPEPLERDSKMPCIVRLIRDGRLGRLNEQIHGFSFRKEIESVMTDDEMPHFAEYLAYEIVAKHCPEGSVEWALWKMLNGKTIVCATSETYKIEDDILQFKEDCWKKSAFSLEEWLYAYLDKTWEICEEPDFKVGDWVRNKHYNTYHQICEVRKETIVHRQAGLPKHSGIYEEHYTDVFKGDTELASLEPDFSNVEVGDMVFSLANGYTEIEDVDEPSDPYPIEVNDEWHMSDGRIREYTLYPIVFNDHHQAKAYYAEMFMKLDEEVNNE